MLPIYNGEKYLKEQIESVVNQTYRNLEIIIIDDYSNDGGFKIASDLARTDNRIKVYKNPYNLGYFSNFLKGASLATGEFICFCDQDDYWDPDKVTLLKALLEKDPKNMLAYSDLEICGENLKSIYRSFWRASGIKPIRGHLGGREFLKNISPGCSMMFRRDVRGELIKASPEAPFIHDHLALVISAGLGKIVYTKRRLVKYRQHSNNNIGAFYSSVNDRGSVMKRLRRELDYFKANYSKLPNTDLRRVEAFYSCLNNGTLSERISFMDYYLYLRSDRIFDKSLGLLECISPLLYDSLKGWSKKIDVGREELRLYAMRVFFISWAVVVLWFYLKEFVLYKFLNIWRSSAI